MLLQHRLNEISSHIANYQAQIDELNAKIAALQAHAQKVGGVEAAMESAVQQLQTAITMVNQVCPDELPEFKEIVDSLFDSNPIAQLPGLDDITEDTESAESPAPTNSHSPEVFDNWEAADKAIQATEPNECIDPTKGVIDVEVDADADEYAEVVLDEKPEWHYLPWQQFVKYASGKGIATKGRKRSEIELDLMNVTDKSE